MTSKAAGPQMPPKRGEGTGALAKNVPLTLREMATNLRMDATSIELGTDALDTDEASAVMDIKHSANILDKIAALEASSPSALIAAVEALPRCWMNCTTMQEAVPLAEVLKLLRAAPLRRK